MAPASILVHPLLGIAYKGLTGARHVHCTPEGPSKGAREAGSENIPASTTRFRSLEGDAVKSASYRPIQIATIGLISLVVLALSISAALTWREETRLGAAQDQMQQMHVFQRAHLRLQATLAGGLSGRWLASEKKWLELRREIEGLIRLGGHLDPRTPLKLGLIRLTLSGPVINPRSTLLAASQLMWEISEAENAAQERMLESMRVDTATQLRLELAAPVALLGFGVVILLTLRRRIINPLTALESLIARLAEGDFRPASIDEVDPIVSPVFENFNLLTTRLGDLEAAHRERAETLEHEVRAATRALLAQQRSLARAERLAATGELAASVAHELRNPLAGIHMTLGNLQREVDNPEHAERMNLMQAEIMRLSKLLTDLLNSARHQPEAQVAIQLAGVVKELLSITRYQLSPNIELEAHIEPDLACRAPESALRQALLNLILNAAAAVSDHGGRVTIEGVAEPDRERVRITVTDDGPGFPDELLARGIRPFFSTREHGTGLGLAVVQRVVRDAGGQIELSNREPHGARVTLLLPLAPENG